MTDATLHGYGRITYKDLVSALGGVAAAWADYDGFHLDAAPTTAPPYTHLWAWTSTWMLRARIDATDAIVGVLSLNGSTPPGLTPHTTEPVTYTRLESHTWPGRERRVGPLDPTLTDRPVDLYQIDGEHPVTFIHLRPPAVNTA
jgi:hypothetical protein